MIGSGRLDIRSAARRILLVLAVLGAIDLAFYALLVRPAVRRHARLEREHQPELAALASRRESVERLEAFLAAVRQAEQDLEHLRENVLSTRDVRMVEAQAELARLAGDFDIDLDSVVYGNEVLLDEELERFSMNVPLEGSYTSLRKFLQAVEESDKFLVVESVALARGADDGQLLNLNIALATYFNAAPELIQRARERRSPERRGRS